MLQQVAPKTAYNTLYYAFKGLVPYSLKAYNFNITCQANVYLYEYYI